MGLDNYVNLSKEKRKLEKKNKRLNEILRLYLGTHHNLRNGLVQVGGFARSLFNKEQDPTRKQMLKIIFEEALRYETLTRDLKKLHDIKSGRETFSINHDTSLYTSAQDIIDKHSLMIEDDFYFINDIPPNFSVGVNDGLVKSIYDNLIGNTIKFNQETNLQKPIKIAFGAEEIGRFIKCHYWDNGIGIKQQNLNNVFNLHFRGNKQVSGSGIGLYYLKSIVKGHGGEIRLESENDLSKPDSHFVHHIFTLPKSELY